MDRRRFALYALVAFAVATAAAIVIGGSRPAGADSKLGGVVLASVVVLVLLDVFAFAGSGGANIGAGFLRLVCLVVIVAVAGRLTATAVAPGRRRP